MANKHIPSRKCKLKHNGEGVGCTRSLGWQMQTVTFEMDRQWDPTAQHRELCVIGSLCCTTEIEETL